MSDTVDEHVAQALASLADVSARQLHATAEALERRRNGLRDFVSVFRDVAYSRELGSAPKLASTYARPSSTAGMSLPNRSPAPRRRFGDTCARR
jgi:hypothetical protein